MLDNVLSFYDAFIYSLMMGKESDVCAVLWSFVYLVRYIYFFNRFFIDINNVLKYRDFYLKQANTRYILFKFYLNKKEKRRFKYVYYIYFLTHLS